MPHTDIIESGEDLSKEQVHERACAELWYLQNAVEFPVETDRRLFDFFMSLQSSREENFINNFVPSIKDPIERHSMILFLNMTRAIKRGAIGGDRFLLEYAERKLYEAQSNGLELLCSENPSPQAILRTENTIKSWIGAVRLLKREDDSDDLDERGGCAGLLYRIGSSLT